MDSWHSAYKHPRWFAKRKKIVERDGNKCTVCGKTKNLVVHHTFYYRGESPPWAYPDESLLTLCNECHKNWHTYHEIEYKERSAKSKRKNKRKQKVVKQYKTLREKIAALEREKLKKKKWNKTHLKIGGRVYKL